MQKIKRNTLEDPSTGCWVWQKSVTSAGYGQFTLKGKYWTAHRYAYTETYGDIPKGYVIRHTCHNTNCCNPSHLIAGTHKDNYADSLDTHSQADSKRRKTWNVQGKHYNTCRDVVKALGISMSAVIKHTVNGVFDVDGYRLACKKANSAPKL